MKKTRFLPEKGSRWRTIATVLIAVVIGMGLFIAKEGKVLSYASNNPKACVNCHVMIPVYNSWMHSSHREWANCNDCHVPQDNFIEKYAFKAKDGIIHSTVFTLRREPPVMKLRDESKTVVQNNCIRCHIQQITQTKYVDWLENHKQDRTERTCWSCHSNVPHGSVRGLSSITYNISADPIGDERKDVVPDWLKKAVKEKK